MKQTIKEIEVNVAYRRFLGYSLTEKIPHFSTFNKNYEDDLKIPTYLKLYLEILAATTLNGFIDSSNIFTDSTYMKASANKKKYEYVHDEYYDCYICPNNKILKYSTTNRDGYRKYISIVKINRK